MNDTVGSTRTNDRRFQTDWKASSEALKFMLTVNRYFLDTGQSKVIRRIQS